MDYSLYLNIALHVSLGVVVGAYGTLVGAGGGFVLVPLFLLGFKLPHEIAVGTSLVIVSANALSGTIGYIRDGKIDYRAGVIFAVCTFPGALVGAFTVDLVSGSTFSRVFGVLLCVIAFYLIVRKKREEHPPIQGKRGWGWVTREHYEYFEPLGAFLSIWIGAISSWFGIGGGIVHVPLMTEVLRFPVQTAVATSHFILGCTALVGAAVHFFKGHVDVPLAIQAGAGALVGAQIGIVLSRKAQGSLVLKILAGAVLCVGIRLLF